jgi:hypothetical protein
MPLSLQESIERAAVAAVDHAIVALWWAGVFLGRHVLRHGVLGDLQAGFVRLPVAGKVVAMPLCRMDPGLLGSLDPLLGKKNSERVSCFFSK